MNMSNDTYTWLINIYGTRGETPEPTDTGAIVDRVLVNLGPAIEDAGASVTRTQEMPPIVPLPATLPGAPQAERPPQAATLSQVPIDAQRRRTAGTRQVQRQLVKSGRRTEHQQGRDRR